MMTEETMKRPQAGPRRREQLPVPGLLRDPRALQLEGVPDERDLRLHDDAA
ncbi:MAG: hypothetical protein MZV70_75465 [Desulfobacterales bacterium]|nr:hypothetical protein [Desulfobacterales bacterium]